MIPMFRALALMLSLGLAASPALASEVDGLSSIAGPHKDGEAWTEGRDGAPMLADSDAINIVVTVVHARPADGGVAPELAKLEHYLLKAFPKYRSFVRLSSSNQRLAVGATGRVPLPNDNQLVVEHTGWKSGFAAIHLAVGGLTTTVNVKDGGTFFQAGRGYDGGMIVLAFEVSAAP